MSIAIASKSASHNVIIDENPATLEEIGRVPLSSAETVFSKAKEARNAQPAWGLLSYSERAGYILKAREYILAHLDEIAEVISKSNGKPITEALLTDVFPICDLMSYFARNTEKLLKPKKVSIGLMGLLGRRSTIHYYPLGVVGIISPWNFPFSIPMSETVMALMAGNAVLLKPANPTAMVGAKIEEIFKAAGLPDGVFQHLPGDSSTGQALLDADIDKMIFTGSVRVGKYIMQKCSERLIPCTLELGGKDAMIVCDDAGLENAAKAAVWGGFCNSGQVCASVERIYVQEKIAQDFIHKVLEKTKKLKQGPGNNFDNDIGPLTTENQLKIVEQQVEEARKRGASILIGGKRNTKYPGFFFEPTVITAVDHSFACVKEETFGPVLPIMTFKTDEEAIQLANDSHYGLTASVWSRNFKRARKIASKVRAGTVNINECTYTYALSQTPWGGIKESGFGRTHGIEGLHELVHIQHIHENLLPFIQDFWWFGYDKTLYNTLKKLCRDFGGNALQKIRAIVRILIETKRKKY